MKRRTWLVVFLTLVFFSSLGFVSVLPGAALAGYFENVLKEKVGKEVAVEGGDSFIIKEVKDDSVILTLSKTSQRF